MVDKVVHLTRQTSGNHALLKGKIALRLRFTYSAPSRGRIFALHIPIVGPFVPHRLLSTLFRGKSAKKFVSRISIHRFLVNCVSSCRNNYEITVRKGFSFWSGEDFSQKLRNFSEIRVRWSQVTGPRDRHYCFIVFL